MSGLQAFLLGAWGSGLPLTFILWVFSREFPVVLGMWTIVTFILWVGLKRGVV